MLIAAELLKKFLVFQATPMSIIVFTRTLHGPHSGPHQSRSHHSILVHCKIHFNINIPSKLRSLSRPLNYPPQKTSTCILFFTHARYIPRQPYPTHIIILLLYLLNKYTNNESSDNAVSASSCYFIFQQSKYSFQILF